MKVFLGGTCNGYDWRKDMIERLIIDYFDPVVDDWTPEDIEIENREKEVCDYNLFVINKDMRGVYSIAEAVDLSNKKPTCTVLFIDYVGFSKGQRLSLKAVEGLIKSNGATVLDDFEKVINFLNSKACAE